MINKIKRFLDRYLSLPYKITRIQEALGRIEQRQTLQDSNSLSNAEFRVFSQWGEDGIIQFLINKVSINKKIFVEFGVEDYQEANTRFLLTNNQWSGLVIDGSESNINNLKKDPIYWASNIKAIDCFITKENINKLLTDNGVSGEIGILSVDIDGNDYWVFNEIDCIEPAIIICEYNSHFGPTAEVTIPYKEDFYRDVDHYSKIYYGTSISALNKVAESKGYSLVASNSVGNNVFFVKDDLLCGLKKISPEKAYVQSHFREHHDKKGNLTFLSFQERLDKIKHLPLFDIAQDKILPIEEINGIIKKP